MESQLSAAQDRIGGAERKAQLLDAENVKIKGELQFWNDIYSQDTGVSQPVVATPFVTSPAISLPIPIPSPSILVQNTQPQQTPMMSTPLSSFGEFAMSTLSPPWLGQSSIAQNVPNQGFGTWDEIPPMGKTSNCRESFGSVFPGISGTQGNGNGRDEGVGHRRRQVQPQSSTFNVGIKPKDPPIYHGRANEDINTWLAKVGDFLYLTKANEW